MVAFRTYILGAFFLIGCIAILFYNGVMVGSFQFFFIERDLFQESFLTIWMHGALEISAIVLAGAAGIVMGRGLVFPGTYNRLYAFQLSAKRSIKIMLGITPIFVAAAFIEGFLTRYTELPDIVRLIVILSSFAFILLYFVIYPLRLGRSNTVPKEKPVNFTPNQQKIDPKEIHNNGTIFTDTFRVYRFFGSTIFKVFTISSLIHAAVVLFFWKDRLTGMGGMISSEWFFQTLENLFNYPMDLWLPLVSMPFLFLNLMLCSFFLKKSLGKGQINNQFSNQSFRKFFRKNALKVTVFSFVVHSIFFLEEYLFFAVLALFVPFIMIWLQTSISQEKNIFKAAGFAGDLIQSGGSRLIGLNLILAFTGFIFLLLVDSPFLWFYLEVLNWNLALDPDITFVLFNYLLLFTIIAGLNLVLPLLVIGNGILLHSLAEIKFAAGLKEKIASIGSHPRWKGLEQEG